MSQDPTLKNVAGMLREQAEAYHDGRHAYDERASLTLAREGWR
jgi:hypothetical protein